MVSHLIDKTESFLIETLASDGYTSKLIHPVLKFESISSHCLFLPLKVQAICFSLLHVLFPFPQFAYSFLPFIRNLYNILSCWESPYSSFCFKWNQRTTPLIVILHWGCSCSPQPAYIGLGGKSSIPLAPQCFHLLHSTVRVLSILTLRPSEHLSYTLACQGHFHTFTVNAGTWLVASFPYLNSHHQTPFMKVKTYQIQRKLFSLHLFDLPESCTLTQRLGPASPLGLSQCVGRWGSNGFHRPIMPPLSHKKKSL